MEKYADDKIVCALVGNKCDLEGERKTRFTEAEMFCSLTPEIFLHFETSAKDNTNIAQLFAKIVTVLMVSCDEFLDKDFNTTSKLCKVQ